MSQTQSWNGELSMRHPHLSIWIGIGDPKMAKDLVVSVVKFLSPNWLSSVYIFFSGQKLDRSKINNQFGARNRFDGLTSFVRGGTAWIDNLWSWVKLFPHLSNLAAGIEVCRDEWTAKSPPLLTPKQFSLRGEECGFKEGFVWNSSIYTRDSQKIGMPAS